MKGSNLPVYRLVRDVHWLFGVLHVFVNDLHYPSHPLISQGMFYETCIYKNIIIIIINNKFDFFGRASSVCVKIIQCVLYTTHTSSLTPLQVVTTILSRAHTNLHLKQYNWQSKILWVALYQATAWGYYRPLMPSNGIVCLSWTVGLLPAQPRDHFIDVV